MQLEAACGLVLIGATAVAVLWANLPSGESYEKFWETHLLIELGPIDFNESLRHVVNDALMTEVLELANITRESVSPLTRLEEGLHPWTSFLIVPLFALANAGVRFVGIDIGEALKNPITIGVALGLVLGKIVGITLAMYLAVRFGVARLPIGSTWSHIRGLAVRGGIGFTVSLFVTGLAFDDPAMADLAKIRHLRRLGSRRRHWLFPPPQGSRARQALVPTGQEWSLHPAGG